MVICPFLLLADCILPLSQNLTNPVHTKNARLFFEISAFPFVPFAINKQFGCPKGSLIAKTQRKTHAKSAQLHFEIFALPFVTFARISSLNAQKGR
jgi:hypothetical protein